jgi:nitrate reductase (cytochrome)
MKQNNVSQEQRRQFMKTLAMPIPTAAASGSFSFPLPIIAADSRSNDAAEDVSWNKAPCRFCGTGCHVQVGVQGGRVVAIAGDKNAEVNKGLLCVKGYHVSGVLYGADRLTVPLLRSGDGYKKISWEEAIKIIADRIQAAPERFAFYGSGQWTIPEGYAAQKFMKGGLANNHIDPNARLCMASAVTGFLATYGVDEPAGCYDDLDNCDVLIMWGNNPAEMHPVLFSRVVDRRSRGEKVTLIDIGTRRTRTTEHCQHYLEMKGHGDLAIANGIAHLLLKNETYSKKFVESYCSFKMPDEGNTNINGRSIDFAEFRKHLEEYTPERVEELSGVPADQIRMLGELFGNPELKITSLWCMGMNQHTRGTAVNSLVHGIHLLSGHFGRPGDAPTSLTGQPSACGTVREVGTLAHGLPGGLVVTNEEHRQKAEEIWRLPAGRINPKPGFHTVQMWEAFCTPKSAGGQIDTIWVQVTNPGQSLPNLNKLFNAKKGQDEKFLIVSDVYPTATTRLADLILPSAMWVEKNGVFGNSERRTQQWFKMVDPPGVARDDCWQTIAVAHELFDRGVLGMKDSCSTSSIPKRINRCRFGSGSTITTLTSMSNCLKNTGSSHDLSTKTSRLIQNTSKLVDFAGRSSSGMANGMKRDCVLPKGLIHMFRRARECSFIIPRQKTTGLKFGSIRGFRRRKFRTMNFHSCCAPDACWNIGIRER